VPLSLKYRPKSLSEVIGQPVVVQAFTNAFKYKTLHHAYILGGNKGSGKTSVSRIIAANENCEKGVSLEPCGVCDNCKAIFAGKSHDVLEMDAASNRSIDDIRELQKNIYYNPIQCRTKYIIIDEAHSLGGHAAEAALKMIEEPPAYVRFILATTEAHKIIDTIQSRCITWKFNKVSIIDLVSHLRRIADLEKIDIDDASIKIAARLSKGSVRDSLQNLQTMMNFIGEGRVTVDSAKLALGAVDDKVYFDLFDAVFTANMSDCYKLIHELFSDGKEIGSIMNGIYAHLNNLITTRACKKDLSAFAFGEDEAKRYCHQSDMIKGVPLLEMMDLMNFVAFSNAYNLDPQASIEKFIIKCVHIVKREKSKEGGK
jgi:DNA polymerase-3 subunit gamma/tau